LEFCTKIYRVTVSLVKPTMKSGSRGFIQNLFCKVWTFIQVFTNFGNLPYFLEFKIIEKHLKTVAQYWAETGPRLQPTGARRPATHTRSKSRLGHGLPAQPSGANGLRDPLQRARATRVVVRSPRADYTRDDAVAHSAVAQRRQGVASEHRWGPGVASGKEEGARAHQNGGSMVRRRKRRRAVGSLRWSSMRVAGSCSLMETRG
jgi:hypothetical protein